MEPDSKEIIKNAIAFFTNRLFILFVMIVVLLYLLIAKLFEVQIVNGEEYFLKAQKVITQKTLDIQAPRGEIFDRYGRPLAVNRVAFTVKIDPSENKILDPVMTDEFVQIMEKNGEELVDDFPISAEEPYTYLFTSDNTEERWKLDMELSAVKKPDDDYVTPTMAFEALREKFNVPEEWPDDRARKTLSVITAVYLQRYQWNQVTMAFHIKDTTVATLEERKQDFPGFYIDIDYLRAYPAGESFSHMLGYTRAISEEEYLAKQDEGYDPTSIVGQVGLEKAFEAELRGKNGKTIVESDNSGVRVSSKRVAEPEQGNNVILTIDAKLQEEATRLLEAQIKQILINKLRGLSAREAPITSKELLGAVVKANLLFVNHIMEAPPGSYSSTIREWIENVYPIDPASEAYQADVKQYMQQYKTDLQQVIGDGIDNNDIASGFILLSLYEQGRITLEEEEVESLARSNNIVTRTILNKVESGEITPQMANLNPSSGSVMVVDVNTGDVLAAASYPTYDNNELVNNFNNAYYEQMMNDKTTPMTYRAFLEPRAPGSTFKPLMAIAALESNAITPTTRITDLGEYREAGWPYLRCWIRSYPYHGTINVSGALEVSCNYFFNEASYRMGNAKDGTTIEGITKINYYMRQFGLGDRSGVELTELYDFNAYTSMPPDVLKLSSPSLKKYNEQGRDPEKTDAEVRWTDGNTIATAIGQSYNNYTAANMVKYIAAIANGGSRYQLHFMNRVETGDGVPVKNFEPNLEERISIQPENLAAVHNGMLAVTQGDKGTARSLFLDFPIQIGAKTGTAEQIVDHASFAAYAPFDDPQIAVYTLIPNGGTLTTAAPAAQLAKDVMTVYFGLDRQPEQLSMNNTLSR